MQLFHSVVMPVPVKARQRQMREPHVQRENTKGKLMVFLLQAGEIHNKIAQSNY
jgi:hypothetical protein